MSLSTTASRISYAGNGSTTPFSFPYKFLLDADLVVILTDDVTKVETVQVITTNYTVAGAGVDAGGTVTMVVAPPLNTTLTIYRDAALTQTTDLSENDSMPAETIEENLDLLTMLTQRLDDRLDRSIVLSEGFVDTFDLTLPGGLAVADTALVTNAAGDGLAMGPTITDVANAATNATAAAASAAAAASDAAQLAAAFYQDVIYVTDADSPITIAAANNGYLYSCDSSSGAIVFNLPAISGLTLPFNFSIKLKTAGNTVTVNRAGSDTIDGATSKVMSIAGVGMHLIADDGAAPDDWTSLVHGQVDDGTITPLKMAFGKQGPTENIGMTLASGTFSITAADGTALSASAPGYVMMPSQVSPGQLVRLKATANHSFQDSAHATDSDIIGELFEATTSIAWDEDRPFYLYAINADDTDANLRFGISLNPTMKKTPVTADIAYLDVPSTNKGDLGMFIFTATDPTTTHDEVPCTLIGGIRMRMDASDDWAVQTLSSDLGDGIRPDPFVGNLFNMVEGQMTAIAGSFLYVSSGTPPVWATTANITYTYEMDLCGVCRVIFNTGNAGNCTNGSAATSTRLVVPYQPISDGFVKQHVHGVELDMGGVEYWASMSMIGSSSRFTIKANTTTNANANAFSNTSDDIAAAFSYKVFAG